MFILYKDFSVEMKLCRIRFQFNFIIAQSTFYYSTKYGIYMTNLRGTLKLAYKKVFISLKLTSYAETIVVMFYVLSKV